MATTREIRRRIRSVKSIAQVTRAMEAVSASKMRRAQAQVQATRPYAERAQAILGFLARLRATEARENPLLEKRPITKVGLVLITADRGLAGGLNSNMIRAAVKSIRQWQQEGVTVEVIAVGRKGRDWVRRFGPPIRAEFIGIGDRPVCDFVGSLAENLGTQAISIGPIARLVVDDFISKRYDAVFLGFTRFWNTVRQEPVVRQLLPIEPEGESVSMAADYIFEPDVATVLDAVLYGFTEVEILQAVFEAIASEYSARMVAMRNATDAADELIGDLTLTYNKVRQASITMSLLDITGAATAVQAE